MLEELQNNHYIWLGKDSGESRHHYFIFKDNEWKLSVKDYELISSETQDEDAWNYVDLYARWKDEVWDWNTEESFSEWKEGIDIWDYVSTWDMYDYPSDVYDELDDGGFLSYGECPNYYGTNELTAEVLEWLDDQDFNEDLVSELKKMYHLNEMTFIQAEPIR